MEIKVSIEVDDDGFMSQECPSCTRRFKIKPGEGSDEPVRFCPYCDHTGDGCWWTQEQADYLGAVAGAEFLEPELDRLAKSINSSGAGGFLSMSMTVEKPKRPQAPHEATEGWPTVLFPCCGEEIQHDGDNEDLFCVICGTELSGSEA